MSDVMRSNALELECRSLAQRLFLLAELQSGPVVQELRDRTERHLLLLPNVRQQFREVYAEWCLTEPTGPAIDWAAQALAV